MKKNKDYEEYIKRKRKAYAYELIRMKELYKYYEEYCEDNETIYESFRRQSIKKAENFMNSANFKYCIKTRDELKGLLTISESIEQKLDQFVYGEENREVANPVLNKYQEIVDTATVSKKQLNLLFRDKKDISDEVVDNIVNVVLKKAKSLLDDFSKRIASGKNIDEQELYNELDSYKADLILTAGVWKGLGGEVDLEDMAGVEFEQTTAAELSKKGEIINILAEVYNQEPEVFYSDITDDKFTKKLEKIKKEKGFLDIDIEKANKIYQIIEIYKRNYRDRPELQKNVLEGFLDILKKRSSNTNIYTLVKNNSVMGFLRYDKLPDGKTKYFGSFNIDASLNKMSLGGALFQRSLDIESEDAEIEAVCDGFSSANIFYIERGDYVVDHVDIDNIKQNKYPDFFIRNDKNNYRLQGLDLGELKSIGESKDFIVKKYPMGDDSIWEEIINLVNKQGFVISRMVPEGNTVYCGFEKRIETDMREIKEAA